MTYFLRKINLYFTVIILLVVAACQSPPPTEQEIADGIYSDLIVSYRFPYKLHAPSQSYELPEVLREISGIDFTSTGELGCIQDERGLIFIYDTEQREINRRIGFAKDADYEGVAFVDADAFVLRDNGNIYRVSTFDTGKPSKEKHKSLLNQKNNTKGMTYDADRRQLLVACKDGYSEGGNFIEQLTVFGYDIDSNTVADSVIYSLNLDACQRYAKLAEPETFEEVFPMFFDASRRTFSVFPSAMAIHPKTKNIYIASGVGHLLFVLQPDNQLLHIERLRQDAYLQVEGMTFRADGTLLLASEGKGTPGMLYEFLAE